MTDSASIVTTELDAIIAGHRQNLSLTERDMAETRDHLTTLVGRRDRLQATLDALTEFREKVALEPKAESVTSGSSLGTDTDPLDYRCPACGSNPGQDCVGLDWGTFHAARPGTARPFFDQVADVQAVLDKANETKAERAGRLKRVGSIGVACPVCHAQPGEVCQPADTGLGYHHERVKAAQAAVEANDRG